MNTVQLIGRLTKDPEVRYSDKGTAIARFSVAIYRDQNTTDFPNIVCFGKTAEIAEKYLAKGRQVGIAGRIQTGSYEKDGRKVYTTEVYADRIELLGRKADDTPAEEPPVSQIPEGFSQLTDDDIPF